MATIETRKNKSGEIISYRFRACVGRDEHYKQVWRTCTIPRPEGLTPAKERKEIERQADAWEKSQKEEYLRSSGLQDKNKITLVDFIDNHWWPDHVLDGSHTPSSINFYRYMSADIKEYFGDKRRLSQIDAETVKRYIKYLNTDARLKINEYINIPFTVKKVGSLIVLTWEEQKKALSYQIFRKKKTGKKFLRIASTASLTFTDELRGDAALPDYQVKARFEVLGDQPYSTTTVIRHYQTFRNILNYALRFGYLKDDPCKLLSTRDKPQKENKTIDFLPPDEAKRYIACLSKEPLYWNCLENVLMTTGLRRGECIGLQWKDINEDKLTLSVYRNITVDKSSETGYHIGVTKGKEERTVPISKRIFEMLQRLKTAQEEKYSDLLEKLQGADNKEILPNGYIFCRDGDPYQPIYPTEPTRWTAKFVKRYGLQNVSPHDLRHTAATLALESGSDLKQVQQLLGHKDPTTTMQFYAGVTEEAQRRTIDGIESLLK